VSDGSQGPGGFDFEQILRMFRSEGPLNFDVAKQVAAWVAAQAEGGPAAVADQELTAALTDLTRTAQLHVTEMSGLGADLPPTAQVLGRVEWAHATLEGLRPVLTVLAERMAAGPEGTEAEPTGDLAGADIGGLITAMAPMLLGVQAGFMIGHLSPLTLSRYEMPMPLDVEPAVVFVGPNVTAFEEDWSLPRDEFRFYLALTEVAHAAVQSAPWVRRQLVDRGLAFASAFEVDPNAVQAQLGDFDPMDPSTFQSAVADPVEFLGAIRTPRQQAAMAELQLTTAVVEDYADFVVERVGRRLITEFDRIREACHRHRVERGEAARFLEALLGVQADPEPHGFCEGVAEREGPDALRRLWEDERFFPTRAEFEAPGLWLARIDLPE